MLKRQATNPFVRCRNCPDKKFRMNNGKGECCRDPLHPVKMKPSANSPCKLPPEPPEYVRQSGVTLVSIGLASDTGSAEE